MKGTNYPVPTDVWYKKKKTGNNLNKEQAKNAMSTAQESAVERLMFTIQLAVRTTLETFINDLCRI